MLVEFSVKNYKSFREKQTLSMVASADNSLADSNLITMKALGTQRLLRSMVVYGANASGKTNLVTALSFVKNFVTDSAQQTPNAEIPTQSFRLDDHNSAAPSEFEIAFVHHNIYYRYGIVVDRQKIHEEWLVAYPKGKPQKWFERTSRDKGGANWSFGSQLKGSNKRLASLARPNVSFLSVAAQFNHSQLSRVYEWFSKSIQVCKSHIYLDIGLDQVVAELISDDVDLHEEVTDLVRLADLGVARIDVAKLKRAHSRKSEETEEKESNQFRVRMYHGGFEGKEKEFAFEEESRGTQQLFAMSLDWIFALSDGNMLIVDEINSSLHPVLVRKLVKLFHDPTVNWKRAQIIFNTHDTTLLDSSLFRRDQIWFTEKDKDGASHLYSLLDYSPRKDEALAKNYLQGRYGAIPFIGDLSEAFKSNGKA